ncbi:hypothetical protein [Sagittula salina]|uniref:Uncharacterized protein n=1 Tax=Sagittula salina TaxID=2820268 RepID=A0A940MS09_9RHOB|nr:hypothetical protein [Sagittula salina]MBP0484770.1 hypothetical protein [Sagittula salina]
MNEGTITEATLQSGLRDIRLPGAAAGGPWAEVLATLALAGLLSLVLAALWRWLAQARRPARATLTLPNEAGARRICLLRRLKADHPDRYDAIRARLYTRDAPDNATLEAALADD